MTSWTPVSFSRKTLLQGGSKSVLELVEPRQRTRFETNAVPLDNWRAAFVKS